MAGATQNRHRMESEVSVYGMTCEHCVGRVTKALESIEGVQDVRVSLDDGKASFSYDADRTGIEEVKQAVESAGYSTSPLSAEEITQR